METSKMGNKNSKKNQKEENWNNKVNKEHIFKNNHHKLFKYQCIFAGYIRALTTNIIFEHHFVLRNERRNWSRIKSF